MNGILKISTKLAVALTLEAQHASAWGNADTLYKGRLILTDVDIDNSLGPDTFFCHFESHGLLKLSTE
jgi:hypothetical protein